MVELLHMRYSVCITNYNKAPYLLKSLESIVSFAQKLGAEIVVVDSCSTDGSALILESYSVNGSIQKIIRKKCSRGVGRDIAFRNSSGDIVIASIDTDVIYNTDVLVNTVYEYERRWAGKILAVYGAMIGTRSAFEKIGGWKDLDRHEDNEVSIRALGANLYEQDYSINVVQKHLSEFRRMNLFESMKLTYEDYRDWFRIGLRFRDVSHSARLKPHVALAYVSAAITGKVSSSGFDEYMSKQKK
ncbi:MAG: glycosyltransferase family A protein [Thermoplasmataceae archaeon]|jgi:glycosyltransferase involved in cell wall biosynthesis